MKKFLKIILCLMLCFFQIFVFACDDNPNENNDDDETKENEIITIYSINDFHGMLFESTSGVGISKLGEYLISKKTDSTLILSAGDMFQGSAVSSLSRGEAVVDAMNYIGFDAMSIGNHEFDWGIDEILAYQDGDSTNGEANFPFICANINDKATNKLASWAKPYEVFVKGGIKIGVIGIIGNGQESDILASYIKDYDFTDEMAAIKKYAKILRTDEQCKIVIVSCHLDTVDINDEIANLTGDQSVDAILNGHTHRPYYGEVSRSNGASVPYVQSGCYGKYIGKITLTYDFDSEKVVDCSSSYLEAKAFCRVQNQEINEILLQYQEFIDIANEELGISGVTMYKEAGGIWASNIIRNSFDADMGILNTGGIRANGFPVYKNVMITYGDIFEIMPFENMVRTVQLTGAQIIDRLFIDSDYYYISSNVDTTGKTIDGVAIDRSKYYTVATIDFLFENAYKPFLSGISRVDTGKLFRDVLAQAVKDSVSNSSDGKFYNEID